MTLVTVEGGSAPVQTFNFTSTIAGALAASIAGAITSAGPAASTTILTTGPAIVAGIPGIVVSPTVSSATVVGANSIENVIAGSGGLTFTAPSDSTVDMAIMGGNNSITLGTDSTYDVVVQAGNTIVQAAGSGTVEGVSGSNTITAAGDASSSDTLILNGTADVVMLGAGSASVSEYGSGAVIDAGSGPAMIGDTGSADTVSAGSGAMTLTGGRSDLIYAQSSTLIFFSGGGRTTVQGGTGATTVVGTTNSAIVYDGTAGQALLISGTGDETLNASSSSAGVVFQAGAGVSVLLGGSGDDTMFGGSGVDTLIGGAGSNVYVFDAGSSDSVGNVTISDFKDNGAVQDYVTLIGYGTNEVANALATATTTGTVTTITLADGSKVTFQGVTSLDPTNFDAETIPNPCYAAGTRIATVQGEVAVEALAVGDRVLTADGRVRPIRWIGRTRPDCRGRAMPVVIRAHAFGAGLPRRDLILSPDHAVFVEGRLIPIKHLINGGSIVEHVVDAIEYWHVELDRHDLLLAEGLPAESYLDTGNRAAFDPGAPAETWHPDRSWATWESLGYAALEVPGPPIGALRARLSGQADAGDAAAHRATRSAA